MSRASISAAVSPEVPGPVSLATVPFPRNERSPLAGIKCLSYAENLVALDLARRAEADEALFLNGRGEVCEAATANVFVVSGDRIVTPPLSSGCLPGTARARVMELARSRGIGVEESAVSPESCAGCSLFLTSATRGVVSVRSIDGGVMASAPDVVEALRGAWIEDCRRRRE